MRAIAVFILATCFFPNTSYANLIVNGSFENHAFLGYPFSHRTYPLPGEAGLIPGWEVTSGNVDICYYDWNASEGLYSLDLSGLDYGTISQTIDTIPGKKYLLTFDMAGNVYETGQYDIKTLKLSVGSHTKNYTFDSGDKSPRQMGWQKHSYIFTAESTRTQIQFSSVNFGDQSLFRQAGPALDNINVGIYSQSDSLLLKIVSSIIAQNKTAFIVHPVYNGIDQGIFSTESRKGDSITMLASKNNDGSNATVDAIIFDISDSSGPEGRSTVLAKLNEYGLPIEYNFGDLGSVSITYDNEDNRDTPPIRRLLGLNVSLRGEDNFQIFVDHMISSLPCVDLLNDCDFGEISEEAIAHQAILTLQSDKYFRPSSTVVEIACRGDINSIVIFNSSNVINEPVFDGLTYTSVNRYSLSAPILPTKEEYAEECSRPLGCLASAFRCVVNLNSALISVITEALTTYVNNSPLPATIAEGIKAVVTLLLNGNPQKVGFFIASSVINFQANAWKYVCENEYDKISKQNIIIDAISQGDLNGAVTTQEFSLSTSNLPNLTISNLSCNSDYISGNDQGVTKYFEIGTNNTTLPFYYETYRIMDKILVYHGNHQIFNSGCIGTNGKKSTNLLLSSDNSSHTFIKVVVIPNCANEIGTSWYFQFECPSREGSSQRMSVSTNTTDNECSHKYSSGQISEYNMTECFSKN